MSAVQIRSIGGFSGSTWPHPQRQLDVSLRRAGYAVEALELPHNTTPEFEPCMTFLRQQCQGLANGVIILHSLSSRLFFLLVDRLQRAGNLSTPLVHTAVLLAPANGRYIADWVPEIAAFFNQEMWVPALSGAAYHTLIVATDNDLYWEEAASDLDIFRQQKEVEILVLNGQGHLNDPALSGNLPDVRQWVMKTTPCRQPNK